MPNGLPTLLIILISTVVVIAVISVLCSLILSRLKLNRGAMTESDLEIEVEALLSLLYISMANRTQPIRITHKAWSSRRHLTRSQEYVVTRRALSMNKVHATQRSGDALIDNITFWASAILSLRPPTLQLVEREYEERVVASGISKANVANLNSQLTDSQLVSIANALSQDKANAVAKEIIAAIQQGNRKHASDTALKVVGLVADGATIWSTTASVISSIFM